MTRKLRGIFANILAFRELQGFSFSSRHLERRICVVSVQVRADMSAHSFMMNRLVC